MYPLNTCLPVTHVHEGDDNVVERDSAQPYQESVKAVLAKANQVPESQRNTPGVCGHWSLKDLLGHLAFWDRKHADALEARRDGRECASDDRDEDEINAEQYEHRKHWGWNEVMNEVDANKYRMEQLLLSPGEAPGQWQIHTHWDEHGAQVHDWIGKNV